jgi:hypothetical protein
VDMVAMVLGEATAVLHRLDAGGDQVDLRLPDDVVDPERLPAALGVGQEPVGEVGTLLAAVRPPVRGAADRGAVPGVGRGGDPGPVDDPLDDRLDVVVPGGERGLGPGAPARRDGTERAGVREGHGQRGARPALVPVELAASREPEEHARDDRQKPAPRGTHRDRS